MMKFQQLPLAVKLFALFLTTFLYFIPFVPTDISQQEIDFANLIIHDSRQERKTLIPNAQLTSYAKWKCSDMSNRGYVAHTTPEGFGPNYLVKQFGYPLASSYDKEKDANNIESLAYNYGSLSEVIEAFWNSQAHKEHIFGTIKFYREQYEYGVAIFANSSEVFYCVVIAKPEGKKDATQ